MSVPSDSDAGGFKLFPALMLSASLKLSIAASLSSIGVFLGTVQREKSCVTFGSAGVSESFKLNSKAAGSISVLLAWEVVLQSKFPAQQLELLHSHEKPYL
jgi:hypothetical protein